MEGITRIYLLIANPQTYIIAGGKCQSLEVHVNVIVVEGNARLIESYNVAAPDGYISKISYRIIYVPETKAIETSLAEKTRFVENDINLSCVGVEIDVMVTTRNFSNQTNQRQL